jgi:GNAT superfamily N-acetyltransferase
VKNNLDSLRILLSEIDGKVVGFIVLELIGWYRHLADINWLAVRYGYWRKGYGSALIKEAEQYLKEKGVVTNFHKTRIIFYSGSRGPAKYFIHKGFLLVWAIHLLVCVG